MKQRKDIRLFPKCVSRSYERGDGYLVFGEFVRIIVGVIARRRRVEGVNRVHEFLRSLRVGLLGFDSYRGHDYSSIYEKLSGKREGTKSESTRNLYMFAGEKDNTKNRMS